MNKTFLIYKHELFYTLRRIGFIVMTFALPVLGLLGIGIFHLISGVAKPPAQQIKIGYVDEAGGFNQFTEQGYITLIPYSDNDSANRALVNKDVSQYFVIPSDYVSSGIIRRFVDSKELAPPADVLNAMTNFISANLMAGELPQDVITRVQSSPDVRTTNLTASGAVSPDQGGFASLIVPGIFGLLLALSLVFSSTYVLQSLAEEKENRMMEILLSSVNTRQLITGKVLGLGTAGLCQVIVWVISLPLLVNLASSSIGGFLSTIRIPPGFLVLGVVYFILGYALFGVLSAGIASVTSTVRDAQSLASIYMLFPVAPFWFFSILILTPNSPIWIVFSIFPFTAPVLVLLRMGITGVPAWQVVVSLIVLAGSIFGGLLLAGKLLRTYMLMYGKRPSFREIARSLRKA
jgi:ABC-2 type transport system permease protein